MPAFVEPALATTANGAAGSARSSAAASAGPVRRPRSSWGTESRSTSITRAADATDECTVSAGGDRQRAGVRRPGLAAAAWRAATRAERLPAEPPETKHAAGVARASRRARRAIASAWFSAQIAPPPSSQPAAIVEDAPTARSNSTLALLGAPGTNARKLGWSVVMVAGASTSVQIRSASSPPIPSGVIVGPAAAVSSSGGTGWSSGCGSAMRRRV